MPLEKLAIIPERGNTIHALFNPEKYTVSKSVQLVDVNIPGLDSPVVQFVRGQNEKINMDLFFDTTDRGMADSVTDVRTLTTNIYKLLKVNKDLHAPPRVHLQWGNSAHMTSHGSDIDPWLVLESLSEEFSLFSPAGIPLRAKLTVSFREAWTIEQQLKETPRQSSDRTKKRRVVRGETVSQIAFAEYSDPEEWRPIADANQLDNPRRLTPGEILKIPRNTSTRNTTGVR